MIEIVEKREIREVSNEARVEFAAVSDNEAFARMAVAAFIMPLNPTLEELSDVKTAVSEAVTNAVIHGYENRCDRSDKVSMTCRLRGDELEVEISDRGVGIGDVEAAMTPMYTTRPELERSGMGFAFMEAFMDELEVRSEPGRGTSVRMCRKIGMTPWIAGEE